MKIGGWNLLNDETLAFCPLSGWPVVLPESEFIKPT